MTIFSIADLHLSAGDKPMDVFGTHWVNHFGRICEDWRDRVKEDDLVLLPGDISWAMRLPIASESLGEIGALPGRKIMIRGNHDYWWNSISRVRDALPDRFYAIQNDFVEMDGVLVAGTRGWLLPGDAQQLSDAKIYERELIRLELSLASARSRGWHLPLICMIHFPPLTQKNLDTGFTQILERYRCNHVVYGHLHGMALKNAFSGLHNEVCYHQVSCDGLDFRLHEVTRIFH